MRSTPSDGAPRTRARRNLTALAAAIFPGTAIAADYATRSVGPWTVSASSDAQGCFLTRTYPSPRATTLLLGVDVDGTNRLTILNANWSIREREQLRLTFRLSNAAFPRHLVVGIAAESKKGFVTSFGAAFPSDFAASKMLQIRRGGVPVDDLRLDGSGAAVAELRKCVDRQRGPRTRKRAVEEERDRIPLDPFAAKIRRDSQE